MYIRKRGPEGGLLAGGSRPSPEPMLTYRQTQTQTQTKFIQHK